MNFIQINGTRINYVNKEAHFQEAENGIWEPKTFKIIDRFLKPGKVFLDIGAWIGLLSIYASKIGYEVVSIEPDLSARQMWWDNVEANNLKNPIQLIPSAVSDTPSDLGVIYSQDEFGDSMSSLMIETGKGQPCTITTIPTILSFIPVSSIALIKIDIEGSEKMVMNDKTLIALSEHDFPPILLSVHPQLIDNYDNWYDNFTYSYGEYYKIKEISKNTLLLK